MKKIFFSILAFTLFATITSGQASASDKLYLQLEGAEGVTIMSFSKDVIDVVEMFVDDEDSKQVSGPLKKVKMLICKKESDVTAREMVDTFEKRPFTEIKDEETDDDSRIFVIRSGRKIQECHFLADADNSLLLLSFYGNFKIEDLHKLSNKAAEMKD